MPSILTPGQLAKKYFASAQDRICEQYCRPSQRKDASREDVGSLDAGGGLAACGATCGATFGSDAALAAASAKRFLRSALSSSLVGGRVGFSTAHGVFWNVTFPSTTHLKTWLAARAGIASAISVASTAVLRCRRCGMGPKQEVAQRWCGMRGLTFELSCPRRQAA